MITQREIARKDFDRVCELNNYETFTEKQIQGYISHVKSIIQKSEVDNLSESEIESINIFNEDLPEIHKAIVLNDDLSRELVFYRERKVIFGDSIEKSEGNDIEKATRAGRYANTHQNRKLGRVGKKYDPRDKKAEEDIDNKIKKLEDTLKEKQPYQDVPISVYNDWKDMLKKLKEKKSSMNKKNSDESKSKEGRVDQKLVDTYTKRLEKVKEQWKTEGTGHQAERAKEYIAHAQRQLDDVKAGKSPFEYQKEEK